MLQRMMEQAATNAGLGLFSVFYTASGMYIFEDSMGAFIKLAVLDEVVVDMTFPGKHVVLFSMESMYNRGLVFTGTEFILG